MSRVCDVCGKGKMAGNKIARQSVWITKRSNKKSEVNLQNVEIDGKKVTACTKCIKTARKSAK